MERKQIDKAVGSIASVIEASTEKDKPVDLSKITKAIESTRPLFVEAGWNEEVEELIRFRLESYFTVKLSEDSIILANPDVQRWFYAKETDMEWPYWEAYQNLLRVQNRPLEIIKENEKVINDILDLSGDPTTDGAWARKGLVMGNVQSGKTQNYIGLINKAMDSGYKIIILLGGHLNDLRKQTQERVDEGVIGHESRHLIEAMGGAPRRIGVGEYRDQLVNSLTSTNSDFNRQIAQNLGINFQSLSDPLILTIKKNTSIMKNLFEWIRDFHYLDVEENKKLDLPLLLIDDEADFATVNTRADRGEITKTNEYIRSILSLFHKSTYVGYTATPFANIFIDPEDSEEMLGDDLYPKDFMIKIPVPENYSGQDFFYGSKVSERSNSSPVRIINDNEEMLPAKHNKTTRVNGLCPSLKEAIRTFIINIAVRRERGQVKVHNTMLVNMTHLNILQAQITRYTDEYLEEIQNAVRLTTGLKEEEAVKENSIISDFFQTFNTRFSIKEDFKSIRKGLLEASNKVKVFGINNESKQVLDYSLYEENGLSAIVIGGHKLSRGLTLEGLSVSYFARNSKMYDTLMQMCRWFGYRPGYLDLCKIFLPAGSLEWYSYISEVIEEIYRELENMKLQEKTPKDFGLKVRDHPGAMMVTARTKMSSAESSIHFIDFWGQTLRRFRFFEKDEINTRNLKTTEKFVLELNKNYEESGFGKSKNSPKVYIEVPHEKIIDFINQMELPEDDYGNKALISQIENLKQENMPKFRVGIHNQKTTGRRDWLKKINGYEDLLEPYDFCGMKINRPARKMNSDKKVIFRPGTQLASADDEKYFLSPEARKTFDSKNSYNYDYIRYEDRDFPSLMIYLFSLGVHEPFDDEDDENIKVRLAHSEPSVGFSVSFPVLENQKTLDRKTLAALNKKTRFSYQTTKIWRQMEMFHIQEDDNYG